MPGMIYSLFDNPSKHKWEPDYQKAQKGKAVKYKAEEWPGQEEDNRYGYLKREEVRIAIEIKNKVLRIKRNELYLKQYPKLLKERDKVKEQLEKKEEELKEVTDRHVRVLKKEIAQYKKDTIIVQKRIYQLKNYTVSVGALREMLEETPEECIIQISDENDNWHNCRFSMLRILLNGNTARSLFPTDKDAKIDP